MKFSIFASFIALACPAVAEDVTQAFLEQPGVTWVATELPLSVQQGLNIPMVPYVRFADGQVESGFFTGLPYFTSAACDDYFRCPDMTQEAAIFVGSYTLDQNIVTSEDRADVLWLLDREQAHLIAMTGDAMRGGSAIFEREGETLVQTRPEGPRTYVALPQDLYRAPVNLAFFNSESMVLVHTCSVATVADLARTPVSDRTERQVQLAAYLRIAEAQLSRRSAQEQLQPYWSTDPLNDADQLRFDQLLAETTVASMFNFVSSEISDPDRNGEVSPETLDTINTIVATAAEAASDRDAVRDLFDALYPDMLVAAPLVPELRSAQDAGQQGINTVFCGA